MLCGNCVLRRVIACFLIFIGVILLISFTPFWVWLSILGTFLVCMGIVIIKKRL